MKILDRYVVSSFVKNYLISFMVLIGMYVVLDMVFSFDKLVDLKGNAADVGTATFLGTLADIGDYYFYQCFLFFIQLSGIIPVVAAAFTLMRLSRFNELTAVLASGVPLLRVAAPIVLVSLALNALVLVDQELVIPQMIPKLARKHDEVRRETPKFFPIDYMQDGRDGLLHAARYVPPFHAQPATMQVVDIIKFDAAFQPVEHISADEATYDEGRQGWDLRTWDPAAKAWKAGESVTGLLPLQTPSLPPLPVDFYQSEITPKEISLFQSGEYIDLLSTHEIDQLLTRPKSFGTMSLLRVKNWRFTQPVMNVLLLLLAIPCVLTREPGHLKTAATKCLLLTGLAMGSVFLAHQIAGNPPSLAWTVQWPALMAWVPIFIFGPLSVYLLDRVKS